MNIRLNGFVAVNGDEYFFDNLNVEIDEDVEVLFDDLEDECDDDCDGYCEDCEFGDSEDDEVEFDLSKDGRFENYPDEYIEFLTKFIKEMYKTDGCPFCLGEVIDTLIDEYFEE